MKMLIKREWNYCKKELTVQILIELAVPLIVFFIYKLNKSILFQAASAILVLPREVYAFLGFGEQIETGNLAFYMLFGMMFMNVWMIWKNCKRMIEIVYRDENNGSIYSLCNQLYSRSQLGISKYLWSIISSLIAYFIFCLEVLILIWIGSFNQEQRMGGMGIILHVAFMGTFVLVMLVSLTFLYVVCYRRRDT